MLDEQQRQSSRWVQTDLEWTASYSWDICELCNDCNGVVPIITVLPEHLMQVADQILKIQDKYGISLSQQDQIYIYWLDMEIRRTSLKYIKCQGGELHDGQAMNLVCVDQRCHYRGLICPVCKIESHDDHYIMPIKIFLQQINKTFLRKESNAQLTTVGDYLRGLQTAKKQVLDLIKKQIVQISLLFQELECKVEEEYLSLRRNILMQSTISTKLPTLITIMRNDCLQDYDIRHQFKKYCELLKFKDNKLIFSDKSKELVNHYQQAPNKLSLKTSESLELFKKQIKQQMALLQQKSNKKAPQKVQNGYKFSPSEKSSPVQLNSAHTQAWGEGFVFINRHFQSSSDRLVFKVIKHQANLEFVFGIGKVDAFSANDFCKSSQFPNYKDRSSILMFTTSGGSCSSRYNPGQSDDEDEGYGFEFNKPGSRVAVSYSKQIPAITLINLETNQIFKVKLSQSIKEEDNWKIFFGLNQGDKIQLQTIE